MPDGLLNKKKKKKSRKQHINATQQPSLHSTNEMSLQLLSHSVTMATLTSEKILDFQVKRATHVKYSSILHSVMIRYCSKSNCLSLFTHPKSGLPEKPLTLPFKNIYLHSVSNFPESEINILRLKVCPYVYVQALVD